MTFLKYRLSIFKPPHCTLSVLYSVKKICNSWMRTIANILIWGIFWDRGNSLKYLAWSLLIIEKRSLSWKVYENSYFQREQNWVLYFFYGDYRKLPNIVEIFLRQSRRIATTCAGEKPWLKFNKVSKCSLF